MQLLVRNLAGATSVLQLSPDSTVGELKAALQASDGLPAEHQVLRCNGRLLADDAAACGDCAADGATLHLTSRLRGGKPVKVKIITNHLPCGQEVQIDITPQSTRAEIKEKCAAATGIPLEHVKVIMSNVNQLAVGDKRTNIQYSACGTTDSVGMAVPK